MDEIYTLTKEMKRSVLCGIPLLFGTDPVIPQGPFDTDPPIPG